MPGSDGVGYKRPPVEHQFRKGQSGNPKGRPKRAKDEVVSMIDALNRKVTVREGNKTRTMTKLEVILETTVNKAMQGDARARADVLKFLAKIEQIEASSDKKKPTGLLVVPGPVDPDEWARAVEKHQRKGRGESEFGGRVVNE